MNTNTENKIERTQDKWVVEYNNMQDEWVIQTELSSFAIAIIENKYRKASVNQANAEFIIKACNNYDSLLNALKDLTFVAQSVRDFPETPLTLGDTATIQKAIETIQKASQ